MVKTGISTIEQATNITNGANGANLVDSVLEGCHGLRIRFFPKVRELVSEA